MHKAMIIVAVVATACSGGSKLAVSSTEFEVEPSPTPVTATTVEQVAPARPVWEGFAASQPSSQGLVAYTNGPVAVYDSPDTPEPFMTLEPTTIIGTVTVLGVISPPADGWTEVMLPVRPNGSTGWVKTAGLELYIADSEIHVDLDARRLTYKVGDVEVLSTDIGIGSIYNETPTGHFFVTDNVTLANPDSPWGPHAFGLSARSDTVTSFNGGDGIIGIHGTNNPSSIGANISLGCVRLPNDVITALHNMVPIGTRVYIEA